MTTDALSLDTNCVSLHIVTREIFFKSSECNPLLDNAFFTTFVVYKSSFNQVRYFCG